MSDDNPDAPKKLVFAPGAFNTFDGTQEELDEFVADITTMFEAGDFMENSKAVDMDELRESDPELYSILMDSLNEIKDPKQLN